MGTRIDVFRRMVTSAALLSLGAGEAQAGGPIGVPISAGFDYVVRERFALPPLDTGLGANAGEIYTDPLPAPGMENAFINPAAWTVDLDACASTGPVTLYRWTIDGTLAGNSSQCDGFAFDFATLGTHAVSLTVFDALQNESTHAADIEVTDHLIVSLGDSFASGEGVPDLAIGQLDLAAATLAEQALAGAQLDADAKSAALAQAIANLADLQFDVSAAFALQQAYQDALTADLACMGIGCIATSAALISATAAYVQALLDLGFSNPDPADLLGITAALNGLIATAITLRDDAQTASDAAQAFLVIAQADLDAAMAALEPSWRNRRCHRSAFSAHVQAAKQLADSDPHSAVTFVHLPCSGATIETGVIGPYDGIEPIEFNQMTGMIEPASAPLPAQLDRARELVCGASCDGSDRDVDAFLLSVGGNDVNFAEILEACVAGEPCFDQPVPDGTTAAAIALLCGALSPFSNACDDYFGMLTTFDAEDAFLNGRNEPPANGLDDLPTLYQALQAALASEFGSGASAALYLVEYPDVTRDAAGASCGWQITQSPAEQLRNLPGVSPAEMAWADAVVQTQLAAAMQTAASTHGWEFVGTVASAFGTHGYCAVDNWIQRVQDSFLAQGGVEGTVHPTAAGQAAIRDVIALALPEPNAATLGATALLCLGLVVRIRRRRLRNPGTGASPSRP